MKEPITLKVHTTVTDGDGKIVVDDTLIRNELSYKALVTMQGAIGAAGAALQHAAEEKAGLHAVPATKVG